MASLRRVGTGLALATAAVLAYKRIFVPWESGWGATEDEVKSCLPGDFLVEQANHNTTRGLTIAAPRDTVWAFLMQLGQGRAGFYSYDWFENLLDLKIESSDTIHEDLQNLAVGDVIPVEPGGGGYTVAQLHPQRLLVLAAPRPTATGFAKWEEGTRAMSTWTFLVEGWGPSTTRLVCRWRAHYGPRDALSLTSSPSALPMAVATLLLGPGEFVMERAMLLGIGSRAEALHLGNSA